MSILSDGSQILIDFLVCKMSSLSLKPGVISSLEIEVQDEIEIWFDLYPFRAFERQKASFVLHLPNPVYAIGTPLEFQVPKSGLVTGFEGFRNKLGGEPITDVGKWDDGLDIYMERPHYHWTFFGRKWFPGDTCRINAIRMHF